MGLRAPVKVKKLSAKEKHDEKVLLGHLYEDKVNIQTNFHNNHILVLSLSFQ